MKKTMEISTDIRQILLLLRQQNPKLAELPDELLVNLAKGVVETMQVQTENSPDEQQDLEKMSASKLGQMGDRLMQMGRWDEAEEYYLLALEKSEKENDYHEMGWSLKELGRLCFNRGDFLEAMNLCQQALPIAERIGDQRLIIAIYN